MDDSTTHIAALVFARPPALNFAACVAELDVALRDAWYMNYTVQWDHEDLVVFNIDSSRVVLAYGEYPHPDGFRAPRLEPRTDPFGATPMAGCLTITIGPGPVVGWPTRISNHAQALLHVMVQRFAATAEPDLVLWHQIEGVFGPEGFDEVLARSVETLAQDKRLLRQRLAAPRSAPLPHRFDQPDVERLLQHLEGQMTARNAPPTPLPQPGILLQTAPLRRPSQPARATTTAQANGKNGPLPPLPGDLPAPDLANTALPVQRAQAEARALRAALYPRHRRLHPSRSPAPAGTRPVPTLPERLTFYTLNTTLMLVALPVGSAILVYNMVRGEDLALGTRAIALTSTAVGILNTVDWSGLTGIV